MRQRMSDKIDLIYDIIKQDREESSDFRKEVRKSHKDTVDRLSKLETCSNKQNQQLAEHMKRTQMLEDLHGNNVEKIVGNTNRITELEKPGLVISTIKKWLIWIAGVAGAITVIAKFLGLF